MASPTPAEWVRKFVPIEWITVDESVQVRGELDPSVVSRYDKTIKEQGTMGALALFSAPAVHDAPRPTYLLGDGFHRLAAYRACGLVEVPCKIRPGTRSDAIRYALRENGHHGIPMSSSQKRHAAHVGVMDPVIGSMTDKEIGLLIGCSPSLVSEVRRGETPAQKTAKKERRSAPEKSNAGRRESESPAPRSTTVRQRKATEEPDLTTPQASRQIQEWLDKEIVEESDLVKLMGEKDAGYVLAPRPGQTSTLKVVGKSGRMQIEVQVIVKQISKEGIVLKFEEGKLGLTSGAEA